MYSLKLVGFVLPWLLLLAAVAVIIFKPNIFTPAPDNTQVYRDSIQTLQVKIDSANTKVLQLNQQYDSLLNIDQEVIYRTRDKIRFIYLNADIDQLDSIIRTSFPGH